MEAVNRKASFDIQVEQTFEAGLVLEGAEIKAIRANRVQLSGAYVKLLHGSGGKLPEVVAIGMHLAETRDPERTRHLLLHQKEVEEIDTLLSSKGRTAVPLKLYLKGGWAKLLIGVGRGRRAYDKRELLKDRDMERDQRQELKGRK